MTITHTWHIISLQTRNQGQNADAVVQVFWRKVGVDEHGNTGEFLGSTPMTSEFVAEGQFVPFEQLTEAMVLGWIQEVVTGEYAAHIDKLIAQEINDKANPIQTVMPPWVAQSEGGV